MSSTLYIQDREIGAGQRPFIIAEIGQAHDGSFGTACAYVEAVAKTGADAIKFQTHIAAAESSRDEEFRVPIAGYKTRYEYWQNMEFTVDQWDELAALAKSNGLIFLSSAFSIEAVDLLKRPSIDMPAWKVGSGEFRSYELLQAMLETGKPILLSSGMSKYEEIDRAVQVFKENDTAFGLFQCISKYPTPLEEVGLNVIAEYKARYHCPVGLSDHSGMVDPSMVAMAQGADLIEVHVTFSPESFGPDTKSSITLEALAGLCAFRDNLSIMMAHPVDKDKMVEELQSMRSLFSKSIAFKDDQLKGTLITAEMLTPKKPATGIAWDTKESVIGRTLVQDVTHDRLLKIEDLADE